MAMFVVNQDSGSLFMDSLTSGNLVTVRRLDHIQGEFNPTRTERAKSLIMAVMDDNLRDP